MDSLTENQVGLRRAIAPVGRRLIARHMRLEEAGGQRLAMVVAERRRPKRMEAITRLAPRREVARQALGSARLADPPVPRPPGMSEFAARWLFADGPPEGIPLVEGADLAEAVEAGQTAAPEVVATPQLPPAQEQTATPEEVRQRAPRALPRGRIEEGARLRLARKPLPQAEPAQSAPRSFEEPAASVQQDAPGGIERGADAGRQTPDVVDPVEGGASTLHAERASLHVSSPLRSGQQEAALNADCDPSAAPEPVRLRLAHLPAEDRSAARIRRVARTSAHTKAGTAGDHQASAPQAHGRPEGAAHSSAQSISGPQPVAHATSGPQPVVRTSPGGQPVATASDAGGRSSSSLGFPRAAWRRFTGVLREVREPRSEPEPREPEASTPRSVPHANSGAPTEMFPPPRAAMGVLRRAISLPRRQVADAQPADLPRSAREGDPAGGGTRPGVGQRADKGNVAREEPAAAQPTRSDRPLLRALARRPWLSRTPAHTPPAHELVNPPSASGVPRPETQSVNSPSASDGRPPELQRDMTSAFGAATAPARHDAPPATGQGVPPPKAGPASWSPLLRTQRGRLQREPTTRVPVRLHRVSPAPNPSRRPEPPASPSSDFRTSPDHLAGAAGATLLPATSPDRLAGAAGATLLPERADRATVVFPRPPGEAATATLARAEAPAHSPSPPTAPAEPLAPALPTPPTVDAPGNAPAASIDELYEQVVERLRRELLVERERIGDLLGELP